MMIDNNRLPLRTPLLREDETVKSEPFVDHITSLIRKSGAFPGVDDDCIRSIAEAASWFSVPGGNTLFSQGEQSEAMYITVNGLFGVNVRTSSGEEVMVGRIGPGEVIGEMGCVIGEPRSATIRTLRASELLALSREALEELARRHPDILLSLYRTVVGRLRNIQEDKPTGYRRRTYCVLPIVDDDNALAFADDLAVELGALGSTFLVTKREFAGATSGRFAELEAAHEYVVYLAEREMTSWSQLCLNQADTIVVVVRGTDAATRIEPFDNNVSADIPVELVLLWPGNIVPGKTALWLDALLPSGHFHVRSHADVGRAARLLTGRGLGLVLSGGGARGLSHLGVASALADHGVTIDAVCGSSIGAYIGASIAMEWDFETMRRRAHEFSRKHPLLELVLPRWSLLSGRNLRLSAERSFGECAIEETPIRYACVTTNLTTCNASIHARGKLKIWVRASCSLPGVFPPILAEDAVHIDGGVVNNLPTDIIRGMGVGFIVAVDVGAARATRPPNDGDKNDVPPLPNILDLLMRVATMGGDVRGFTTRRQCDILLTPNVQHLSILSWRAYDEAIKRGYDCTVANIDRIKQRITDAPTSSALSLLHF
jgi:NTE family protein